MSIQNPKPTHILNSYRYVTLALAALNAVGLVLSVRQLVQCKGYYNQIRDLNPGTFTHSHTQYTLTLTHTHTAQKHTHTHTQRHARSK